MRIDPIGSVNTTYSTNYFGQIGKIRRINGIQDENAETNQKKQKKQIQLKMAKKMNAMAEQMQDMVGYYDENGIGNHYKYFTFEEIR